MTTQKKCSPALRFAGFTDDWEQRKLGKIAKFAKGQGYSKSDLTSNGCPIILYGMLYTNYETVIDKVHLFVKEYTNSIKSNGNEVIVPASGETAEDIARASAVLTRGIILGGDLNIIYPDLSSLNPTFLALSISNGAIKKELEKKAQGKSVVHIRNSDLQELLIKYPTLKEQSQIGNFFKQLDETIALHKRKLAKLFILKSAFLTSIFCTRNIQIHTQNPISWEQRKVTELGEIYIGLVTTMTKSYSDKGVLLIRNSDIKDNMFDFGKQPIYLENEFAQKNLSRMHKIGDVITVHTGDVGTSAVITKNEENSIGFATIVTRPNTNIISSSYLCTFLNTQKHKNWATAISTGDGRTNYNLKDYFRLVVPLTSLEEQTQIGNFFKQLDETIALHKRKQRKYQQIKQIFLRKMLID